MYISENFLLAKTFIYIGWKHINKFKQCIYTSASSESVIKINTFRAGIRYICTLKWA